MTVPSGRVVFGPITTWRRNHSSVSQTEVAQRDRGSCRSPEITFNSHPSQLTYVVRQDTLFIQPHACFHLNVVTDDRLADQNVPANVNIIPDVGMFQLYIVTC